MHLFSEAMAVGIYAIIAVVLLWPLILRPLRGGRRSTPDEAARQDTMKEI
jgi:hypothetical protein